MSKENRSITITVDAQDAAKLDKITMKALRKKFLVPTKRGSKQVRQSNLLSIAVHYGLSSVIGHLEKTQKDLE